MTESKALVGPLTLLRFGTWHNSVRIPYAVPRNTMDPRHALCFNHRTACDCREAELAEQLGEYQAGVRMLKTAVHKVLVGHRLFDWGDDNNCLNQAGDGVYQRYLNGDGPLACQCTGCQIVRASHEYIPTDMDGLVLAEGCRW